ncbi:MAG: diacylglycerol kinase family protein [Chloroflexi bacterium]|nr:diacylglycerol kinase family protein [Chloroflexota bacterium]
MFRTQANFRIHLAIAAIVLLCGLGLGLSGLELAVVALTAALVIFAEMINTVVETVVDLITLNHDPRAKVAKDVSAGAVLLSAVGSIFVGILVFGPHLLRRLG